MNGELAQAIALTAHGNAALATGLDLGDFESRNSTFEYVRSVTFDTPRGWRQPRPSHSVVDWVAAARRASVSRLVLALEGGAREHAGFANAGSHGIVGIGPQRVGGWYGSWHVNSDGVEPNEPRPRIWEVSYKLLERRGAMELPSVELSRRRDELVAALQAAREFAGGGRASLEAFVPWLDEAVVLLDESSPQAPFHPDMLPPVGYSDEARQLLAGATRCWVFGGMGSWNDIGFADTEEAQDYATVSDRLYGAVLSALSDATNSFST